MVSIPKGWDPALETLLAKTPNVRGCKMQIQWTEPVTQQMVGVQTFVGAVHSEKPRLRNIKMNTTNCNAETQKAMRVRHMIEAPLTPRKPVVITSPLGATRQRDKCVLEKVVRSRKHREFLSSLASSNTNEDRGQSRVPTRTFSLQTKTVSSAMNRKPILYWGT